MKYSKERGSPRPVFCKHKKWMSNQAPFSFCVKLCWKGKSLQRSVLRWKIVCECLDLPCDAVHFFLWFLSHNQSENVTRHFGDTHVSFLFHSEQKEVLKIRFLCVRCISCNVNSETMRTANMALLRTVHKNSCSVDTYLKTILFHTAVDFFFKSACLTRQVADWNSIQEKSRADKHDTSTQKKGSFSKKNREHISFWLILIADVRVARFLVEENFQWCWAQLKLKWSWSVMVYFESTCTYLK